MKEVVVDTNSLLRYLLKDIPEQAQRVREIFKQSAAGVIRIVVTELVLAEVVYVLTKSYGWDRAKVVDAGLRLVASPLIDMENRSEVVRGLNMFKEKRLSFVDCMLAARVIEGKKWLFTFDIRLKKMVEEYGGSV